MDVSIWFLKPLARHLVYAGVFTGFKLVLEWRDSSSVIQCDDEWGPMRPSITAPVF